MRVDKEGTGKAVASQSGALRKTDQRQHKPIADPARRWGRSSAARPRKESQVQALNDKYNKASAACEQLESMEQDMIAQHEAEMPRAKQANATSLSGKGEEIAWEQCERAKKTNRGELAVSDRPRIQVQVINKIP